MAISLCRITRIVACGEAGEVRNAKEADDRVLVIVVLLVIWQFLGSL